jgi:alcohol dehydrogenase class IV
MNALAHAIEALYTPLANPVASDAAYKASSFISLSFKLDSPVMLPLGAILAGYASGSAGFAVHHAVCQTIVRVAGTPHAQTNAVMLPHFVRMMEARAPDAIAALAAALGAPAHPGTAADRVAELSARAEVTRLGELGVVPEALEEIARESLDHPALANTPTPPDAAELLEVLGRAL